MKIHFKSFFQCNAGHAPIAGQSAANIVNLKCKHINTSTSPPFTMGFRICNHVQTAKATPYLFKCENIIIWAVTVWEWQRGSNWATEWTDRTKAQKISRLSLAVAGDWDAEPHPQNNKSLFQTQKFGKSQKVSGVLSAKGRMKIVCAKCRFKIRKALLKFDSSNDHRGNNKIHMFFMFEPLGTEQEIHGWQPKTR